MSFHHLMILKPKINVKNNTISLFGAFFWSRMAVLKSFLVYIKDRLEIVLNNLIKYAIEYLYTYYCLIRIY